MEVGSQLIRTRVRTLMRETPAEFGGSAGVDTLKCIKLVPLSECLVMALRTGALPMRPFIFGIPRVRPMSALVRPGFALFAESMRSILVCLLGSPPAVKFSLLFPRVIISACRLATDSLLSTLDGEEPRDLPNAPSMETIPLEPWRLYKVLLSSSSEFICTEALLPAVDR